MQIFFETLNLIKKIACTTFSKSSLDGNGILLSLPMSHPKSGKYTPKNFIHDQEDWVARAATVRTVEIHVYRKCPKKTKTHPFLMFSVSAIR